MQAYDSTTTNENARGVQTLAPTVCLCVFSFPAGQAKGGPPARQPQQDQVREEDAIGEGRVCVQGRWSRPPGTFPRCHFQTDPIIRLQA